MSSSPAATALEHIVPSRHLTLTLPSLQASVLDSPILHPSPPQTAAMLVPAGRTSDWLFSTHSGHLHLLLSSSLPLSRLILVFPPSHPSPSLLLALCPRSAFLLGLPSVPVLSYEDGILRSVKVEEICSDLSGEMLVEDVEIEVEGVREWRRRLRFKRMPNLVQSQIRIPGPEVVVREVDGSDFGAQPYLVPMAAGLVLVESLLEGRRPRAVCVGVGGGGLLGLLEAEFGFNVVGVEVDEAVVGVAKRHFGLVEGEGKRVLVGDGIGLMEGNGGVVGFLEDGVGEVDVVMVDLDSGSVEAGLSAPPVDFVRRSVLDGVRRWLRDGGILVVNVVPLNRGLYEVLVELLEEVFTEVYEIDVNNGENFVVVATTSRVETSKDENVQDTTFRKKLEQLGGQKYLDSIRKT